MKVTLEYDCPFSGVDFDHEVEYLDAMKPFRCLGCEGMHKAGQDVDVNVLMDDGTFIFAITVPF